MLLRTASALSAAAAALVDFQKLLHLFCPPPSPLLLVPITNAAGVNHPPVLLSSRKFAIPLDCKVRISDFQKMSNYTTHHRHQSKINFVDSKCKAHVYIIIIKDTADLTIDSKESSVYLYIEQIN